MFKNAITLKQFTINNEVYKLIVDNEDITFQNTTYEWLSIEDIFDYMRFYVITPENCLGYTDTISLNKSGREQSITYYALAYYQKHSARVMQKCERELVNALHKYQLETLAVCRKVFY